MNINITVLSVQVTTVPTAKGGSYQVADVAYKNNTYQGKVEGKKVMSFGATEAAFKVLADGAVGQTFDVEYVQTQGKDGKTYNNWVKLSKGGVASMAATPVASTKPITASPKSTYETPEERARKQVYITRMGCLNTATNTLSVGAKKLEPADVIATAKQYEAFVLGNEAAAPQGGATGFDDVPDFDAEFPPEIK